MLSALLNAFFPSLAGSTQEPASRVHQRSSAVHASARQSGGLLVGPSTPVVIGPTNLVSVRPAPRAAWDDKGWSEQVDGIHKIYDGAYSVRARNGTTSTFPGRIIVTGNTVHAYIADPPPNIRRHAKGPCFQLTQAPWFKMHWARPATNVDDAILYIENILSEVLQ